MELRSVRFIILVILFIPGCGEEQKPEPIPDEEFVQLYTDILVVYELYKGEDSLRFVHLDSLYSRWGVDSTAVLETFDRYCRDPQQLAVLYEHVIAELELRSAKTSANEQGSGESSP